MHLVTLQYPKDASWKDAWHRERFARKSLVNIGLRELDGLIKPQENDVFLASDIDEVPRPNVVKALRLCAVPDFVTLQSSFYYYSYQWKRQGTWNDPHATLSKGNETRNFADMRQKEGKLVIPDASWHCSSCFRTLAEQDHKVSSFSHASIWNITKFRETKWIVDSFRFGTDIYNCTGEIYHRIEKNLDVPGYIKQNGRFEYLLSREPPNANFEDVIVT